MNIILEERQSIILNNNIAQKQLLTVLSHLSASTTDISITDELFGDLDFSVLSGLGFKNIKTILLPAGKITGIKGLPNTLTKLSCPGNLIIVLEMLPMSLTCLECEKNHITILDLETTPNLVYLSCGYNKLTHLNSLPESLLKLYCSHNSISKLDLLPCSSITVVDVSDNHSNLIIQNRPSTLTQLNMDSDVSAEIRHTAGDNIRIVSHSLKGGKGINDDPDESNRDVVDSLNTYFRMKSAYEIGASRNRKLAYTNAIAKGLTKKQAKNRAASVIISCINCRQAGGTIFKKKDNKYIALCGNSVKPCNLDIKIFTGIFYDFDEILHEYRVEMEKSKQTIILQKMDTLFNYVSEANSAQMFKSAMEKYNAKSEITKDLIDKHTELYNNLHKRELIIRKEDSIYAIIERIKILMNEYKNSSNIELLREAVDLQIRDLSPEILGLRQLKYEVMEVNTSDSGDSVLFQRDVNISNMVFSFDEPPKVIRFVRKY